VGKRNVNNSIQSTSKRNFKSDPPSGRGKQSTSTRMSSPDPQQSTTAPKSLTKLKLQLSSALATSGSRPTSVPTTAAAASTRASSSPGASISPLSKIPEAASNPCQSETFPDATPLSILDPNHPLKPKPRFGLVLTGGGARAAYQVGVLRALAEITGFERSPFQIISGFSAGAINGTWLASHSCSFEKATKAMWDEWSTLTTERVFRSDLLSVSSIAAKWIQGLGLGGLRSRNKAHEETTKQITYLLDTTPLYQFIRSHIDFDTLNRYLHSGELYGLSVTAANYRTGHSTAFFWGHSAIKNWEKLNRISVRTEMSAEHVMASAAIPIFFPPVRIGDSFYGDGMVRLNAPLSAAIHLGSDRMMVIGIRGPSSTSVASTKKTNSISLGEIAGTILNGLFFDALDADLARMERINRTLSLISEEELQHHPDHLRPIPVMHLRPSEEVACLPARELAMMPGTLRFFLKGLGLQEEKGADLLSYLAFEPKYIQKLLELGYEDTVLRKDQILEFFQISSRSRKTFNRVKSNLNYSSY
jgi:NTE family protein